MVRWFKRAPRLAFAFKVCRDLGISDPISWVNATPPKVLDAWMAFYWLECDDSEEMTDPEKAFEALSKRFK